MLPYKSRFSDILVSDVAYFMDFHEPVLRAWKNNQDI